MQRKKIRKRLLCLAAIIIIISVAGVVFRTSMPSGGFTTASAIREATPPCEVLRRYFYYLDNRQFEHMYAIICEISQSTISKDDFITRNRNIYEGIDARNFTLEVIEVTSIPERPRRRFVEYSLRMDSVAGEISHTRQAIFELNSDNEFRLQWNSYMIFPGLGSNDRVRVTILPAKRGRIFDRNWEVLAGPGSASTIGFVPGRMREGAYKEEDIATIAELLEMTPERVLQRLGASYVRDDTFVLLRTIAIDAQDLINELLEVQGIMVSSTTVRYYPLGRRAAHLVGYVQNINAEELEELRHEGYHMNSLIGRAGLERIYESTLRARDGREVFIVDSYGNRTSTIVRLEPRNGEDVRLTIDANTQIQLYNLFSTDKSASVAMNPLTGEVLALVSTPSYDPNDFVRGMTASTWTGLMEDEALPMFNRFRATFSPGSTMKAITAAIGVDAGVVCPRENFGRTGRDGLRWQQDESWGRFFVTTVTDYSGPVDLNNAMAWSDNIYFAQATLRIGAEAFGNGLRSFGFDQRIPFEYGLFSSTISRTGYFSSDILLADSGYGQGEILMNPVHLAAIYTSFVNGGNILEPQLILGRSYPVPIWISNVFSPETANAVLESLIFSVDYGTGRGARVPGVALAGKTGTAELKLTQDDTTGRELGWFVMLTADETSQNPLLVVSMVEDVQGRGGSNYVATRVRALFE